MKAETDTQSYSSDNSSSGDEVNKSRVCSCGMLFTSEGRYLQHLSSEKHIVQYFKVHHDETPTPEQEELIKRRKKQAQKYVKVNQERLSEQRKELMRLRALVEKTQN